jgi:hypothetical protein
MQSNLVSRASSLYKRPSAARNSLLFGEPAVVKMLKRNELLGVSKITGAIYWYYFKLWYPYIAFTSALLMYIIPLVTFNQVDGFLFYGGMVSIIHCLLVLLSYILVVPWRKHPSPLILYRAMTHLVFSVVIIFNAINATDTTDVSQHSTSCKTLSFVTQYTFFSGECWLLFIAVDLYLSLTNPFTFYKSNIRKYHIIVWTTGFISAMLLIKNPSCQVSIYISVHYLY